MEIRYANIKPSQTSNFDQHVVDGVQIDDYDFGSIMHYPVDNWTDQLVRMAPYLPDAHAIRVELLARMGRHLEAVVALKLALAQDCPWFRSGISFLVERMRLYLDVPPDSAASIGLDEAAIRTVQQALRRLAGMARHLDTPQLFTTFLRS